MGNDQGNCMKKIFFTLFLFIVSNLYCDSLIDQKNHLPSNKKYYLTVCAIFKNEAQWLREWIEYHRIVGVDHFLLYNNESTDHSMDVLEPYIEKNIVNVVNWPDRKSKDELHAWVYATQVPAYNNGIKLLKKQSDWIAFIDIDEFIVPITATNLKELLQEYQSFGALAVNWDCYGCSNIWDIPQNKLMIECLTRKAPIYFSENRMVKSIVQSKYVKKCKNPHEFQMKDGIETVKPNFVPFKRLSKTCHENVKVNHYTLRTLNYLYNHKIPNKAKMDNLKPMSEETIQGILSVLDQIDDEKREIFRFVPELRKVMNIPENL